jgi:hypothetical protein
MQLKSPRPVERPVRRRTKIILAAIALPVLWMVSVDRSWFVARCPDCGHYEDIFELRLFTIPIKTDRHADPGIIERVAIDLGVPCKHRHMEPWHKHRYWGLFYCAAPCINGVCQLTGGDEWYTPEAAAKARHIAATDPSIPAGFKAEVLTNHNMEVWWEIGRLLEPPAQPPN